MRFLDWLAHHLTYPMLKRWMIIGVCACPDWLVLAIPVKLLPVALFSSATLFAQPLYELGAIECWFYVRGRMKYFIVLVDALFRIKRDVFCRCKAA